MKTILILAFTHTWIFFFFYVKGRKIITGRMPTQRVEYLHSDWFLSHHTTDAEKSTKQFSDKGFSAEFQKLDNLDFNNDHPWYQETDSRWIVIVVISNE